MKRFIAALLVCTIMLSILVMPASAAHHLEDPLACKDFETFGAEYVEPEETLPEETIPEETQPEETEAPQEEIQQTEPAETVPDEPVPEETEPQETESQETEPAETQPEETLPEETEPEESVAENGHSGDPRGHNGVPLYFQTDYPDDVYGMSTIAKSGCSAACLAMIATYMTGHEYLPDEIARYFGGAAENNIARLETGSETMKLPYKKSLDWHETLAALHQGKVAVVLLNANSIFANYQHFIILTGISEDGRIMVNDSYEPNYETWDTKAGLAEGFEIWQILQSYSGAWIYDKAAMPEKPFLYSEPEPVRGEPRYDFELTEAEKKLLAKVVWLEARGECNEGQQAVAEVILNRLAADGFQSSLSGVIYAEGQFNSAKFLDKAEPYQLQYEMVENALYGPYVLPEDVYYFATAPKTSKVWGRIGGHIFCYAEN